MQFMEALNSKIALLEEELAILRKERDRFKNLANEAHAEIVQRREKFLRLEEEYEKERSRRVNLEMSLPADSHHGDPKIKTRMIAREVIDVDRDVVDSVETPIISKETKIKYGPPKKRNAKSDMKCKTEQSDQARLFLSDASITSTVRRISQIMEMSNHPSTSRVNSDAKKSMGRVPIVEIQRIKPETQDSYFTHPQFRQPSLLTNQIFPKGDIKTEYKSEDAWILSSTQVTRYLEGTPRLTVKPSPLEVAVSRKALNEEYGLPHTGLLWNPENKPYRFLLPTYDLNPQIPHSPGEPGLLLSCRDELWKTQGAWSLFIKVPGLKVVRLNYAGEYMCRVVGEMTAGEFTAQSSSTKMAWGQKISTARTKNSTYIILRARISMRKMLGHEPTEEQVKKEANRILKRVQDDSSNKLTSADVIGAFERGEERITIVKLICVSYTHQRAKEYADVQLKYERKESSSKGKRKAETTSHFDSTVTKKHRSEDLTSVDMIACLKALDCVSSSESSSESESDQLIEDIAHRYGTTSPKKST